MKAVTLVLTVGLLACTSLSTSHAADKPVRTADMEKAARAFLKAYREKNLDAMMASADAPFLIGTVKSPKKLSGAADLRAELKRRLSDKASFDRLPKSVARVLTWDKAFPSLPGDTGRREELRVFKQAIDVTGGMSGGYAAMTSPVPGRRGTREVSSMRLLVGNRNGEAKVVGIQLDD